MYAMLNPVATTSPTEQLLSFKEQASNVPTVSLINVIVPISSFTSEQASRKTSTMSFPVYP